jgi:hypothetical protein
MSMIPVFTRSTFGAMRRVLITLVAIAALGLGVTSALASFHAGTYSGEVSGERVLFTTDTHHAHSFTWGTRTLFDDTAIEHVDGIWRFHTHSTRWQVHGHWDLPTRVQGSICALDSHGACASEHLQHYTAELKTKQ